MRSVEASPLRLGVSDKVPPHVDGGHSGAVSWGGRAFAVGAGEQGALISGKMQEGLKEEFSDTSAQGDRLHERRHPDGLAGAPGVEL